MMTTATLRYIVRYPSTQIINRGVAQPGSAPPWGGGGRRFKSSRPDQLASLRFQLHSQGQGRPSLVCPFSGTNVQWTFVISPLHPYRGARIPGPSSSLTPGVRRIRVEPSRSDQSYDPYMPSLARLVWLRSTPARAGSAAFPAPLASPGLAIHGQPVRRHERSLNVRAAERARHEKRAVDIRAKQDCEAKKESVGVICRPSDRAPG